MTPSHILVPLDGSPLADDALVFALDTFDCEITVLNVVTAIDESMSESGLLEPGEDRREAARERAESIIENAKRRAEEAGRSVETTIETGDPAETIVESVEDHAADHIVMGGHGGERNEIARRLLGTVATKVVGEAPVSVTVVR